MRAGCEKRSEGCATLARVKKKSGTEEESEPGTDTGTCRHHRCSEQDEKNVRIVET